MGVRRKLSSAPLTHAQNQEWNIPMQHLNDSLMILFRVCAMSVFKLFQCGLPSLVVLEVLEGLLYTLIQDFKVINAMMFDKVVCGNESVLYMKYKNSLSANSPINIINMSAKRYYKERYSQYSKTSLKRHDVCKGHVAIYSAFEQFCDVIDRIQPQQHTIFLHVIPMKLNCSCFQVYF